MTGKNNINIAVVINEKYVSKLAVMLNSLFLSNKEEKLCVYIFYAALSKQSKDYLGRLFSKENQEYSLIKVDISLFANAPILDSDMAREAYFKLLIPIQLPDFIDRVLYLDADIIVNGSIHALYRLELGSKAFAAVKDFNMDRDSEYKTRLMEPQYTYFNSGVLLFDLKKFKTVYSLDCVLRYIQENGQSFRFHDQEVLNALFHKEVKIIDEKYNFITLYKDRWDPVLYRWRDDLKKIVIIHYAAGNNKPWKPGYCGKYLEKYWEIALKTGFKEEYQRFKGERKKMMPSIWKTKFCIVFPDLKKKIKKLIGR